MGSCLSCKSGGGAKKPITIKMDSGGEKADENSGLIRGTPYSRNNNGSTFGFKRRMPSALKSLSRERTNDANGDGPGMFVAGSMETLSSASSINSDDLMLDFEHEDPNASFQPRPGRTRNRRHLSSTSEGQSTTTSGGASANFVHQKQMIGSAEKDEAGIMINSTPADHSMLQDVTDIKSILLKLQQTLIEADTLNPFDSHLKNGLFYCASPRGRITEDKQESAVVPDNIKNVMQENFDLRRQLVFLQQQLEEKNQTIKLLQQQLIKSDAKPTSPVQAGNSNAATQTDKPRLSLTTVSQSYEETTCGTTVSSNQNKSKKAEEASSEKESAASCSLAAQITRSLNSLMCDATTVNGYSKLHETKTNLPERSASAIDLCNSNSAAKQSKFKIQPKLIPENVTNVRNVKNGKNSDPSSPLSKIAVRVFSKGSSSSQQPRTGLSTNAKPVSVRSVGKGLLN